jgi:hypothetical protein
VRCVTCYSLAAQRKLVPDAILEIANISCSISVLNFFGCSSSGRGGDIGRAVDQEEEEEDGCRGRRSTRRGGAPEEEEKEVKGIEAPEGAT